MTTGHMGTERCASGLGKTRLLAATSKHSFTNKSPRVLRQRSVGLWFRFQASASVLSGCENAALLSTMISQMRHSHDAFCAYMASRVLTVVLSLMTLSGSGFAMAHFGCLEKPPPIYLQQSARAVKTQDSKPVVRARPREVCSQGRSGNTNCCCVVGMFISIGDDRGTLSACQEKPD